MCVNGTERELRRLWARTKGSGEVTLNCVMAAVLCCCAVRDDRHARSRALHVFLRLGCSSFCGPSECLRGQGDGSSHGPCAVVRQAISWLFSFFSLRRSLPAISAFDANEAFVWEGATVGNEGLLGAKSIARRPSRTREMRSE